MPTETVYGLAGLGTNNKAAKKHCLKEHVLLTFPNDAFPESDLIRLRDIMILAGIRDDNFLDNNFLVFIPSFQNILAEVFLTGLFAPLICSQLLRLFKSFMGEKHDSKFL